MLQLLHYPRRKVDDHPVSDVCMDVKAVVMKQPMKVERYRIGSQKKRKSEEKAAMEERILYSSVHITVPNIRLTVNQTICIK